MFYFIGQIFQRYFSCENLIRYFFTYLSNEKTEWLEY